MQRLPGICEPTRKVSKVLRATGKCLIAESYWYSLHETQHVSKVVLTDTVMMGCLTVLLTYPVRASRSYL